MIVAFPFSDQITFKRRPALVIADAGDGDLLLARITTAPAQEAADIFLLGWQSTGLLRPSWLRLAKLAVIAQSRVDRTIGTLGDEDARNARRTLLTWLSDAWDEPPSGSA